jgi:hypothetical protein
MGVGASFEIDPNSGAFSGRSRSNCEHRQTGRHEIDQVMVVGWTIP